MRLAEKEAAVSGPPDGASGWYGPGAYLAWLLAAYTAALSSIWHSKCAEENEDAGHVLDGEMLAAIFYPSVAVLDLLSRFIRCQIHGRPNSIGARELTFLIIEHGLDILSNFHGRIHHQLVEMLSMFQEVVDNGWQAPILHDKSQRQSHTSLG